MARWPAPLRCKSRLAVGVGASRAAAIQSRLTAHVLHEAAAALQLPASGAEAAGELVLAVSGLAGRAAQRWGRWLGADRTVLQGSGRLGARLSRQVRRACREGAEAVLLIGTDLPGLDAADLRHACRRLAERPLVLGPALDGGYWLIGLRGDWPRLFAGERQAIRWGGDQVLRQTLAAAEALGLPADLLAWRADLDHPVDLLRWR